MIPAPRRGCRRPCKKAATAEKRSFLLCEPNGTCRSTQRAQLHHETVLLVHTGHDSEHLGLPSTEGKTSRSVKTSNTSHSHATAAESTMNATWHQRTHQELFFLTQATHITAKLSPTTRNAGSASQRGCPRHCVSRVRP